jgi:KUP system potassium uptake protein
VFQNSNNLGNLYGVAVTGTFVLNTILFIAVARGLWHTPKWRLALLAALFLTLELAFFSANLAKLLDGAYVPLAVGLATATVMITWRKGREIVTDNRTALEGSLPEFLDQLPSLDPPIRRVPGTAIFLNPGEKTTPLALRATVEHTHAMHDKVVIVSVDMVSIPQVDPGNRFSVKMLGHGLFKVTHVTIRCGYQDRQDVPEALALARKRGLLERNLDLEHASYFLSRIVIRPTGSGRQLWRKKLFVLMARNAASPIEVFRLPGARTVIVGEQVAV